MVVGHARLGADLGGGVGGRDEGEGGRVGAFEGVGQRVAVAVGGGQHAADVLALGRVLGHAARRRGRGERRRVVGDHGRGHREELREAVHGTGLGGGVRKATADGAVGAERAIGRAEYWRAGAESVTGQLGAVVVAAGPGVVAGGGGGGAGLVLEGGLLVPVPVVEIRVVVGGLGAVEPVDGHALVGRRVERAGIDVGILTAGAADRPETRAVCLDGGVAGRGGGLDVGVVGADAAGAGGAPGGGEEQQPELGAESQAGGDEARVGGHRGRDGGPVHADLETLSTAAGDAVEAAGILDCPPRPGAAVLRVRRDDAENEVRRCVCGALENDEIVGARVERGAGGRGERVHGVVRVAGRGRQGVLQGIQRAVGGRGVDVDGECLRARQVFSRDIDPDRSQAVAAGIRPGVEPLGVCLVLVASCHAGSNGRVYAPPGVADEHVGGRGGGAGDTGGVAGADGVDGGDAVVAGVAGGEAGVGVGGVGGGGVGGEVGPSGGAVGGDLDLVPGDGLAPVVGGGGPGQVDLGLAFRVGGEVGRRVGRVGGLRQRQGDAVTGAPAQPGTVPSSELGRLGVGVLEGEGRAVDVQRQALRGGCKVRVKIDLQVSVRPEKDEIDRIVRAVVREVIVIKLVAAETSRNGVAAAVRAGAKIPYGQRGRPDRGLRLGLQRQGDERGEGREEHGSGARREGPDARTPRPPRFGSPEHGLRSSDVNTRVKWFAWLHAEQSFRAVATGKQRWQCINLRYGQSFNTDRQRFYTANAPLSPYPHW